MAFDQFEKKGNALRKSVRKEQRVAPKVFTPAQVLSAIKNKEIPAELAVLAGTKKDGSLFTIKDLEKFRDSRRETIKKYGGKGGVLMAQLIASSTKIDIDRANGNAAHGSLPRSPAVLYRVAGNMLSMRVPASHESKDSHHQVRVRLEDWQDQVENKRAKPITAAKNAVIKGKISFDCDCGRHKYWYRYVATAGGFAIRPFENRFPKVKNPRLKGTCCKHVLKAFALLKSPTVHVTLSRSIQDQREGGITNRGFLKAKNIRKMKAARPRDTDKARAKSEVDKAARGVDRKKKNATSRKLKSTLELFAKQQGISLKEIANIAKQISKGNK